ncbi:hypothetical protein C8R44DRAFT_862070 [Mycena epipterygia]|nr:hypothetical protein C8R44DRAFT_862070 [Mycena epipterygia]
MAVLRYDPIIRCDRSFLAPSSFLTKSPFSLGLELPPPSRGASINTSPLTLDPIAGSVAYSVPADARPARHGSLIRPSTRILHAPRPVHLRPNQACGGGATSVCELVLLALGTLGARRVWRLCGGTHTAVMPMLEAAFAVDRSLTPGESKSWVHAAVFVPRDDGDVQQRRSVLPRVPIRPRGNNNKNTNAARMRSAAGAASCSAAMTSSSGSAGSRRPPRSLPAYAPLGRIPRTGSGFGVDCDGPAGASNMVWAAAGHVCQRYCYVPRSRPQVGLRSHLQQPHLHGVWIKLRLPGAEPQTHGAGFGLHA